MQVLHAYELEAAGFGMQLMRQVGVSTLDQWYSDFVETDWRYVERYYQTDQLPEWKTCIVGLDWGFDMNEVCEIIECISGEALAVICKVVSISYCPVSL